MCEHREDVPEQVDIFRLGRNIQIGGRKRRGEVLYREGTVNDGDVLAAMEKGRLGGHMVQLAQRGEECVYVVQCTRDREREFERTKE